MAHPNKAEGIKGHNAKLRRLTTHYGAANPRMFHPGRVNYPKSDGPEDAVGFGADSAAANARSDRPARRASANDVATYRRGGKVKKRADGGPVSSGPAKKGKGKGKTNITINVAPPPASPPTGVSGLPMGANPAMPPPRPPMPPPGAGAPPGMPPGGGPPGMPPGGAGPLGQLALQQKAAGLLPRKRGGRVHPDAGEDKKLVKRMVKGSALKHRAQGGPILKGKGAESGEGRLARNRHMDHKLKPTTGVEG